MMKKLVAKIFGHSLTKNSAIVFVGSMVANVSAYLYHLAVGRILGPVAYGELTAIFSLFFILNVPAQVLQTVLVRYFSMLFARDSLGEAKELFWKSTRTIARWGSAGGVLFLIVIPFLSNYLHIRSYWYFVWLYVIFFFFIISIINASAMQGFQRFTAATSYAALSIVLRIVFGVPAAFFGVGWTLLANAVSNIVTYATHFVPIRFLLHASAKRLSISKQSALSYSTPAFLAMFGMTGLYTFDILYVKHFFPPFEAGLYASATVLGKIIFFATSAVGYVLFPVIAARKERKEHYFHLVAGAAVVVFSISFGLVGFYFLYPEVILHLLFGSQYQGAMQYLGLYGLFIAFVALNNLIVTTYLAIGCTRVWMLTTGVFILQTILIYSRHETLSTVIVINIACAGLLFALLLLYYPYARRHA